ncbi:MAG: GNAT family N-acetyltransferase, partial [Flavobacteriaceae bacterium]|nr:GNAT family N-acetyltransferase [Flavobacteriaceae bacterium]
MDKTNNLLVRPMEIQDIEILADYWLLSNPRHLVAMGVDLSKLPKRSELVTALREQLELPIDRKQSYALIWEENGTQIGHTNINQIIFGQQAYMHLHLWSNSNRQKGLGQKLVRRSLPFFFEHFDLQNLYCEPYVLNPAPNRTLQKLGFEFVKRHITIPGSLNFEQEVNLWMLTRKNYLEK